MKLLVVTDAWRPQTNGVVTTLQSVLVHVEQMGHEVHVVEPGLFHTLPLPSYPEIRVTINPWRVGHFIRAFAPDAVHIATEGPLGLAARRYLRKHRMPFTTSLHTKFPEYANARWKVPLAAGYAFLRAFHRAATSTLVTTVTHRDELLARRFERLLVWGRGVDTDLFRPLPRAARPTPKLLYVGRVAVEKNLEAFLSLDVDGIKTIVGDGPARAALEARYPDVEWLGYRWGNDLVACYADADVLVFPSRTDTFGLVMLEAMACGTPVAAYPVTGPIDVVQDGVNGALDADLRKAIGRALVVDRSLCRRSAELQGWHVIAQRLVDASLAPGGATYATASVSSPWVANPPPPTPAAPARTG